MHLIAVKNLSIVLFQTLALLSDIHHHQQLQHQLRNRSEGSATTECSRMVKVIINSSKEIQLVETGSF